MSHTLTINDGVESTTLALANTAATGYHLLAYNPVMAQYVDQRVSSLYTPGDYSVQGKYGNVVETITVEIVGASRDDLFVKLRALYRAIENARDWVQFPNQRNPSYLTYQLDSTTNPAYSTILGGRVDVAGTDSNILAGPGGETEQLSNVMGGVTITIEREPFWRNGIPVIGTANMTAISIPSNIANVFGKFPTGVIPGDLPASLYFTFSYVSSAALIDQLWVGYRSSKRTNAIGYDAAGLYEAENGTMGTDTTATTDGLASPGGVGNTKASCTFATPTDAERVTLAITAGWGSYRVFARTKLSAASTVSLYAKFQASDVEATQKISNAPAIITNTTWRVIDLGIVNIPSTMPTPTVITGSANRLILSASRSAGAGNLDIDFIFLLPVDEGMIKLSGASTAWTGAQLIFTNTLPGIVLASVNLLGSKFPFISVKWSGNINLQPGNGEFYFIGGDANFEFALQNPPPIAPNNNYTLATYYYAHYLTARGNG